MIILELSDFDNFYGIAQSIQQNPKLQAYIDRFEESYIKRILGVELGQKFIDDIKGDDSDSSALEDRFLAILEPFIKQDSCKHIHESKGMKAILAGLIYSEFVEDDQLKNSQSGVIINQSETSDVASVGNAFEFASAKWNSSVISIHAIQWLCGCFDIKTYPEYEGTYFRPKYPDLL